MADYSEYYFKDLLETIEEGCQKIGEKRDYVKYLLSMEQAESVKKLIEIYDNIYKLLFVFTYGNTFPHDWYKPDSGGYYKPQLVELLNRYFNDNIERLSPKYTNIPEEELTFFIANLRECANAEVVHSKMLEKCSKTDKTPLLKLRNAGKTQHRVRKSIESMNKMDRSYEPTIKMYNRFSALLALKGRISDVSEIAFAKDNGINYDTLIEQYKEDEERRKKEIDIYDESTNADDAQESDGIFIVISKILLFILVLVVAGIVIYLIFKTYIAFIIILALLSFVWKGKS